MSKDQPESGHRIQRTVRRRIVGRGVDLALAADVNIAYSLGSAQRSPEDPLSSGTERDRTPTIPGEEE